MRIRLLMLAALSSSIGGVPRDAEPLVHEARVQTPGSGARFRPPVIHLDGEPLAVVRFSELPPDLPVVWKTLSDGRRVRRYSFVALLRTLGVDAATLSEAHFHGGRARVARIAGKDLAKSDVLFSFTQDTRGKARFEWPPLSMVSDTVDGVLAIGLYRDRALPQWNEKKWRLELDGRPLDGPAYAEELPGGVRVYRDNLLAGVARRANVGESPRVLAGLLDELGIARTDLDSVDLVFGDEGALRFPPSVLEGLTVAGLQGAGGQLSIVGTDLKLSAVLMHTAPNADRGETPRLSHARAIPAGGR
jgi:hypothetical protein